MEARAQRRFVRLIQVAPANVPRTFPRGRLHKEIGRLKAQIEFSALVALSR